METTVGPPIRSILLGRLALLQRDSEAKRHWPVLVLCALRCTPLRLSLVFFSSEIASYGLSCLPFSRPPSPGRRPETVLAFG